MKHLGIPNRLENLRGSIERLGGEVDVFKVEPPATATQIEAIERQVGRRLPAPLRRFFLEVSAGIDVLWTVDTPDREFWGRFDLQLADLPITWTNWTGWRDAFANPTAYDWPPVMNLQVFEAAFPLLSVANGDQLILFDDDPGDPGEVMYLNHERGEGDRVILATSLERFLNAWIPLGCPGPDFEDLVDFYDFDAQELSLETETSREWLRYLSGGRHLD